MKIPKDQEERTINDKRRFFDPADPLNRQRMMRFCFRCRHFHFCVANDSFCPPYSLAIRMQDTFNGKPGRAALEEEISQASAQGWTTADFCDICSKHCKINRAMIEKGINFWVRPGRHICGAMAYLLENLFCPIPKPPAIRDAAWRCPRCAGDRITCHCE